MSMLSVKYTFPDDPHRNVSVKLQNAIEQFLLMFPVVSVKISIDSGDFILATKISGQSFRQDFSEEDASTNIIEIGKCCSNDSWTIDVATTWGKMVQFKPQRSVRWETVPNTNK